MHERAWTCELHMHWTGPYIYKRSVKRWAQGSAVCCNGSRDGSWQIIITEGEEARPFFWVHWAHYHILHMYFSRDSRDIVRSRTFETSMNAIFGGYSPIFRVQLVHSLCFKLATSRTSDTVNFKWLEWVVREYRANRTPLTDCGELFNKFLEMDRYV